jgi:hypothetical protein
VRLRDSRWLLASARYPAGLVLNLRSRPFGKTDNLGVILSLFGTGAVYDFLGAIAYITR